MMWKDFFYYSKSERRAVWVLLVLIVLLFFVNVTVLNHSIDVSTEKSLMDSVHWTDVANKSETSANHEPKRSLKKAVQNDIRLKPFDPNLADSFELSKLGLPSYVVRNILKYRQKGGRFSTVESLSRIYGLTEEMWIELKPYVRISKTEFKKKVEFVRKNEINKNDLAKILKYPKGVLIDVNVADTTELKKIPGIASGIAKAIVSYRNRLGGFYNLEQLREINYITPDLLQWFKLENVTIQKLKINEASLETLRRHPYLNFYQAKTIVDFRRKKGPIKSLSQLSLYEEFSEKDLERLSVYVSFD